MAAGMDVQIRPFLEPTSGFGFLDPSVEFRFVDLSAPLAPNDATHILIQGLTPVGDVQNVLVSSYEAVNLTSGAVQDVGMVYLSLPAGAEPPPGTVTSPIVGVVQRTGDWSQTMPSTPSTTVGDAAGDGFFNVVTGSLSFSLSRNTETFTGNTRYTVLDADTVEIEAFTIHSGSNSYAFLPALLARDGNRLYGTIVTADAGMGFDSLMFAIEFLQLPDTDGDGIPDIVDSKAPGLNLAMEPLQWQTHPIVGQYIPLSAVWAYSPILGFFKADSFPYVYQASHGWMVVITRASSHYLWLYSPAAALQWIVVDDREAGMFRASGDNWQHQSFFN
jgi:hypothetical protein